MRRVASSKFTIWVFSILFAYWFTGLLTPYPDYFSGAVSGFLLVFSGLVFGQWGIDALRLVIDTVKNRRQIHRGDELSLIGVALLATGAFYQGTFALSWLAAGQPSTWLGTAASGFGRFILAMGFMLMFISPLKAPTGSSDRFSWWAAGPILLLVAALAFVLGSQWGATQDGASLVSAHSYLPR